jgi:glutathione S-transferase
MPVNLYGLTRSVYTRIARLALEEKGIDYALHEVEIFGPDGVPAEHRARHPFGRIPAFEHDGFRLYETSAITHYVDDAFAGPPLQPREPASRARMNQIIGVLDSYAYRAMVWGVFVARMRTPRSGPAPDEGRLGEALAASAACLDALDELIDGRPHLLGPALTLADLQAYPVLWVLSLAPEGAALLARRATLQRWLDTMAARPSVQRTTPQFPPR